MPGRRCHWSLVHNGIEFGTLQGRQGMDLLSIIAIRSRSKIS